MMTAAARWQMLGLLTGLRSVNLRRAATTLLLIAAAVALSACSGLDRQQAEICVAVATAVAPPGETVTIRSVESLSGVDHAVRVEFTVPSNLLGLYADCVFAGGPLERGRGDVLAVRTAYGMLREREVAALHRWFLDKDGDIAAAIAETGWRPPAFAVFDVAPPARVGYALQQLTNLLDLAALYAPLALAYTLIYGLIRRINLAFGEIAMIGSYGAVFGIVTAATMQVTNAAVAIALALIVAVTLAALWGWFVGRTIVLPLASASTRTFIVATLGLSLALSEGLRLAQGPREIWMQPMLETPIVLTGGPFPVVMTEMRVVIVVAAAIILPLVVRLMVRSRFGRAWRAVADDALMAEMCGIDPVAVTGQTLILASALAAGAGTVLSLTYGGTNASLGFVIGLKALLASLVGGAGSLGGALLGGLLIAAIETIWSAYFDSSSRDIVVLGIVTLTFLIRPQGLLGRGAALEEGRLIRLS